LTVLDRAGTRSLWLLVPVALALAAAVVLHG
jgi:hypothetical protein